MSRTDATRGALIRVTDRFGVDTVGVVVGVIHGDGLSWLAMDLGEPKPSIVAVTDDDTVMVLNPAGWRVEPDEVFP